MKKRIESLLANSEKMARDVIDNVTQADEGCDLTYMQYKE